MSSSGQILKINQTVRGETSGMPSRVQQYLGGGGQGEVYKVDQNGATLALKWYYPQSATPEQRKALENIIMKGTPSDRFLWPQELASNPGVPNFGYLMPMRPGQYKNIVDLMKRRIEPTLRALARAGRQLADSFFLLHSKGLCYRDISFGNVFFDPKTGDVLICDNDNVTVDGEGKATVLGTPRFMAPEIVRGEAKPSTQTDLFSLSVLLFYMLTVSHPLEGKKEASIRCFDLPAMNKIYGTEPVFIFDPNDQTNRPIPGIHDNAIIFWKIYPQFLRDLFTQAFTQGITDPVNGRVRESIWRQNLANLEDWILYCSQCGAENFYDPVALKNNNNKLAPCWNCKKKIPLPYRIRIKNNIVMLNHDTKLYPHHIDLDKLYDYGAAAAEVMRHPSNPDFWGLKNLTDQKWTLKLIDGTMKDIEPGRSASLSQGACINFGKVEGEIRI